MLKTSTPVKEDPLYNILDTGFTVETLREAYPEMVTTQLEACRAEGWQALKDAQATKDQLISAIVAALRVLEARYSGADTELEKTC